MEGMLKDKVCIVTGAGRGIGRETALLFADHGAKLVISELDEVPAAEVVDQIKSKGGEAVSVVGDVTAPDFPEKLIKTALETYSDFHVIVNNAGYTWDTVIHKMSDEQWDAIQAVHLGAPFKILRAAAAHIRAAGKKEMEQGIQIMRKVVNVSSTSGIEGNPGQVNYSSAKAGLVGMTKTMAKEWGRYNVNVNCVAFGWIETRLTAEKEKAGTITVGDRTVPAGIPKANQEAIKPRIPLGRPGTANEAARTIFFFASPLSDYVSGQVLKVTGGS